jgi:hypothetical protein
MINIRIEKLQEFKISGEKLLEQGKRNLLEGLLLSSAMPADSDLKRKCEELQEAINTLSDKLKHIDMIIGREIQKN